MESSLERFRRERERLNAVVHEQGTRTTARFFNLDGAAYRDGALPAATKELLGLVASLVLRCEDCIRYHLIRCVEEGHSRQALAEAMDVALVVGGSILIPHLRRAHADLAELLGEAGAEPRP